MSSVGFALTDNRECFEDEVVAVEEDEAQFVAVVVGFLRPLLEVLRVLS